MKRLASETTGYVRKKTYFCGDGGTDEYLAVEIHEQVFENDGWKDGDKVKIIIIKEDE